MRRVSQGNGKTVRTERAMAVFPPNWVTAGGPASARAGMNGTLLDVPVSDCHILSNVPSSVRRSERLDQRQECGALRSFPYALFALRTPLVD